MWRRIPPLWMQAPHGGGALAVSPLFFLAPGDLSAGRVPEPSILRQALVGTRKDTLMTEEEILARAAGLTTGLMSHPKEVAEAIAASRRMAAAFTRPADETAEPMPAYAAPVSAKGSRA